MLVGEWYLQVEFDNTLTEQGYALNAGLYAFVAHTYGSPYGVLEGQSFGNATVDGLGITTGTEANWWNCLVFAGGTA